MKKVLLFLSAALVACSCGVMAGSSSDGLGTILGGLGNILDSVTGGYRVSLPGTWTYNGVSVSLDGEGALTSVTGAAAATKVENEIDGYLRKIGIRPGAATFTFNEDGTFTTSVSKVPINGTWAMGDDGKSITMAFGSLVTLATLTGTVTGSVAGGCDMLFDGDKFLGLIKTLIALTGNSKSYAESINSLMEQYSEMKVGFKLVRA